MVRLKLAKLHVCCGHRLPVTCRIVGILSVDFNAFILRGKSIVCFRVRSEIDTFAITDHVFRVR